ncbi:outer membrane protein assembly factor BamA [Sandaracinobacteroides saxicola]|uniref:Outer membrane protein assembly factor BamA n=1 Tax=Sandaracinobacteroides saxicola TaxID=2759707 RepID=A0A7G5IMF6_9SPHN|nr:outer membrane protein assembly factor BamA [Sandaracinobacteroides saxicola]QMW24548.1 outer membrane protein assembly factor BamA [Sandaracinobacteroides saxicola]
MAPLQAQVVAPPAGAGSAAAPAAPAAAPAPPRIVRSITVTGNERLEPDTVRSYIDVKPGERYDRERLDRALKDLFASELFADVQIRDDGEGGLTIQVKENPVINRIIIEGAKRIKDEKIREEIKIAPRQIFTRSKARTDVGRILELYRRSGRFAASVEPKIVQLDQNRVDVVFEIFEGAKSNVRQINILGNTKFSDGDLRAAMATRQARWYRLFSSNDTYDPDRLAFDQQKMRQFYLTNGYADFRVVSAVAELTPDRRDFIVTYVVEEGERYKFGDIEVTSQIRDMKGEEFRKLIRINKGDWYDAKKVEDTIDGLTETVGLLGYAFGDVRPNFSRDKDKREMNLTFVVNEVPRTYVEAVNINGNTVTRDKVIRREFRLAEGDAFNSFKVKRSRDRIQSLGFFQEKLEVKQNPGSGPDKVTLGVDVEEKPTGSLQISAGFSSLERFILSFSIEQRNFRGMAQQLRLSANVSSYSKSVEVGFTDPYLFDRNVALGFDVFRRDFNSFRFGLNNDRQTTYKQITTGFQVRAGFPITEYWSMSTRYGLSLDDVTLDRNLFFTNGVCDPLKAGRYLCEALGKRTTSSVGYSVIYDNLDNRVRPSRGQRFIFNQDIAGLGGSVKYVRSRVNFDQYWNLGSGFILNAGIEAGNIFGFGGEDIRLTDRFFLGEPRMRGFGIRGLGPRVIRKPRLGGAQDLVSEDRNSWVDDALGGKNMYNGRLEMFIPLGSGTAELGLRPSVFVDVGSVWSIRRPVLIDQPTTSTVITNPDGTTSTVTTPGFKEFFFGDTPTPRISIGAGVSWNSPFGPFRFDLSKAIKKVEGDTTQIFQFNVGTQF